MRCWSRGPARTFVAPPQDCSFSCCSRPLPPSRPSGCGPRTRRRSGSIRSSAAWGEGRDRYAPLATLVAVVLAFVALGYATYQMRRWALERQINRLSATLSTTDPSMVLPSEDQREIASGVPAPRIQWVAAARKGMPKLRPLTPTTNIVGAPRLEIAYLRLFNNEYRHVSFVKGAWREFGTVSMLRSAASMTFKEAKRARHVGLDSLFVTTRQQLESELTAVGTSPRFGANRLDAGPRRVRVRDRYGAYPMRSVLCSNSTWRAAVDRLLDTADVVVLDLSGYTDQRAGTRYELQRVLDRVPAERLILLADPVSKGRVLENGIAVAWASMSVGSPNVARPDIPIWIARVDRLVTTEDQNTKTTRVELVTSRKETRRLMAAVQDRLRSARPIVAPQRTVAPTATSTEVVDPWRVYAEATPAPATIEPGTRHQPPVGLTEPTQIERPPGDHRRPRRRRALYVAVIVLLAALVAITALVLQRDGRASSTDQGAALDVEQCDRYVVQLGAFPTEMGARQRLADVGAMLVEAEDSLDLGWIREAPCGFSAENPAWFFALGGPFESADEAERACRSVRAAEVAHVDQFPWATNAEQLAGHRRLDGPFQQCAG